MLAASTRRKIMSVGKIKKYHIECDHCQRSVVVERVEKVGIFFSGGPPLPMNWKRTEWLYPRCSAAGQGGGDFDQCPECAAHKKVDVPKRACEITSRVGSDLIQKTFSLTKKLD